MKLEVGKRYVRRDGKVTGPIELYNHEQYHFRDSMHAHTYHESGVWSLVEKTERDLISEYIEPEVVKDEVKTLRDEVVMAVLPSIIDFYRHALSLDLADGKIDKAEFNTDHLADLIAKDSLEIADAYLAARKERA